MYLFLLYKKRRNKNWGGGLNYYCKKESSTLSFSALSQKKSKREKDHQWDQQLATALSLPCAELGTSSQSRENPKRCSPALRLYFKFLNVGMILIPQTQPGCIFLASFISRPVKTAPPAFAELEQVNSAKRIHMSSGTHCS